MQFNSIQFNFSSISWSTAGASSTNKCSKQQ